MNPHNTLHQLGLSENESHIYITGLRIGSAKASQLAKESGLERVMTYHTLKSLQEKGLVRTSGPKRSTLFTMEPARALQKRIENQKRTLEDLEKEIAEIARTTQQAAHADQQTEVYFYMGKEGVEHIARDLLNTATEFYSLSSIPDLMKSLGTQLVETFQKEAEEKGITSKSIWTHEQRDPIFARTTRELRIAPPGMQFPATILLYNETSIIFTPAPSMLSIVIKNADVNTTLCALFEQLWEQSRPV